jgi:toxin ParE1/3/4
MRVLRWDRADEDINEQACYIARDSVQAALRFLQAVDQAIDHIGDMPFVGALYEHLNSRYAGVRFWPVRGFENHIIFYRVQPEHVEIMRIFHGARDIPRVFDEEA